MADRTRRKIYDSAVQLFAAKDYKDVSVDSIVKLAEVAKGSFYVHFASKDALVTEIIRDQVEIVDSDYKGFIDGFAEGASAEEMMLALIGRITDVLVDVIGYERMKVVYGAQISKDVGAEVVSDYNREIYDLFGNILGRGVESGEFSSEIPAEVLTRHFMMAIRGITYEWCIRYPDFDYKEEALRHFEILLAGIRK
jgi:AcrR family transcriptional regulator